jgi:hypothetical protein
MKVDVPDLERHELATPREGFISDAEHGALPIRAKAFAGALDKVLDILPAERMRLVLTGRGLAPIFFNPNLTASLEEGFRRPAAMCTRAIVAT